MTENPLYDEIDRLRKENARLKKCIFEACCLLKEGISEIDKLEAEIERLKKDRGTK
jgi:hypothetical protein